ncbi:hypothetical protein ACROYT_G035382 [Oculina patagonica]
MIRGVIAFLYVRHVVTLILSFCDCFYLIDQLNATGEGIDPEQGRENEGVDQLHASGEGIDLEQGRDKEGVDELHASKEGIDSEQGRKNGRMEKYWDYFNTPHFNFFRDTLSYLALLGLHFAICLEPSRLSLSSVEWVIMVFYVGRLVEECKQIWRSIVEEKGSDHATTRKITLKNYVRDRWNILDFITLLVYFVGTFRGRITTWAYSESVTNNRNLLIASYLYGINTMLLTIRIFGQVLETIKGVGTIQIALLRIIENLGLIVLQFVAITVAFSIAITKVYVAEKSLVGEGTPELICNAAGIRCWWSMLLYLTLSLLGLTEGLPGLSSADTLSVQVAHILFVVYLILASILLINMLIALLSDTYQRVYEDSEKEWAFKHAIRINTYSEHHPVPVPFNLVSNLAQVVFLLMKKEEDKKRTERDENRTEEDGNRAEDDENANDQELDAIVDFLQPRYKEKYGNSFPVINKEDQIDYIFNEIQKSKQISVNVTQ